VTEIQGLNEGKEFEAALHLRKKILALRPALSQSKTDHIKIFGVRRMPLKESGEL
jgi:hypothetical protein